MNPVCFIIMPISTPAERVSDYENDPDHFRHIQDHLFFPAIESAGFEPVRPAARGSEFIHDGIIANLERADLVLCDMSTLNANVFFELGIRTALNKAACMIRDSLTPRVPFDVGIINYHVYNPSLQSWVVKEEIPKLAAHIKEASQGGTDNSLWRKLGLTITGVPVEEKDPLEAKLDLALQRIDVLANSRPGQEVPGAKALGALHAMNILEEAIADILGIAEYKFRRDAAGGRGILTANSRISQKQWQSITTVATGLNLEITIVDNLVPSDDEPPF